MLEHFKARLKLNFIVSTYWCLRPFLCNIFFDAQWFIASKVYPGSVHYLVVHSDGLFVCFMYVWPTGETANQLGVDSNSNTLVPHCASNRCLVHKYMCRVCMVEPGFALILHIVAHLLLSLHYTCRCSTHGAYIIFV